MRPLRIGEDPLDPYKGDDAGKTWEEIDREQSRYAQPRTMPNKVPTLMQSLGVPWWAWLVVAYAVYKRKCP